MKLKYLIFILIISITNLIYGQNYPVQVNLQLIPPYTVYLSDFTSSMFGNRMQATVLLKDMQQNDLQVKLKFTIQGLNNNVIIQTSSNYMPTPILLNSGVPEIINGEELAEYFDPQNLTYSGLDEKDFRFSSRLPEGLYKFTLQVVEYNRGVIVSNQSIATVWLLLNEPPKLISPSNNTLLNPTNPQNIVFTWMPMHTGSPNSTFSTEYEFAIAEVPNGISPQEAIEQNNPGFYYSTKLSSTSFLYNNDFPALEIGKQYAFRVRAYDVNGLDLFKNDGYSEINTFTNGHLCDVPLVFKITDTTRFDAHFTWFPRTNNEEWKLMYRPYISDTIYGKWADTIAEQTDFLLTDLKPGTKYQIKISAICALENSVYSPTFEFNTKEPETLPCDDNTHIPIITNKTLVTNLIYGQKLTIGIYTVFLTSVHKNQDKETFNGTCFVSGTPFHVKLRGKFTALKVNTDLQVIDGDIKIIESNEINNNKKAPK